MSKVVAWPKNPVGVIKPISSRRVSERVTLAEWAQLCATVDAKYGKELAGGAQLGAWGMNPSAFFVGSYRSGVRFSVLEIRREEKGLQVLVDVGTERRVITWEKQAA